MLGLFYKDFYIQRKMYILTLAILAAAVFMIFFNFEPIVPVDGLSSETAFVQTAFYLSGWVLLWTIFSIAAGMELNVQETDKQVQFLTTTPAGRDGIITSKFLFAGLFYVIYFVAALALEAISRHFYPERTKLTSLIIILFVFSLAAMALGMPIIAAFGTKMGNAYKSAVFILVILLAVLYFLFGDISFLIADDGDLTENFQKWLIKVLATKPESIRKYLIFAGIPAAVVLNVISWKISCMLFRRYLDRES